MCNICEEEKPIEEFHWADKEHRYRRGTCMACKNAGSRVRNKHPAVRLSKRDASRKARRANHERLLEYIGGKYVCEYCGYTDECTAPFDFHHIDRTSKELGVGNMMQLSWERVKSEVDKCIILCSNCHRKVHKCKDYVFYEED